MLLFRLNSCVLFIKLFLRIPVLLLLVEIGSPVISFSQTENSVDQLKQKLKQFQQHQGYLNDTAYASALTDLAYIYSSSYPDSALLILRGNAERCKALGFKKEEITTYLITGDAFQAKGIYGKAMENFEKALQLAKQMNFQKEVALALNRIGIIYLNQGNYPEASGKFYESLKAGEAISNDDLTGVSLNNIAIVEFYQGRYSEAETAYIQRLKIAQKLFDTSSMSVAYNGIGEVNLQQKEFSKALRNLNTAYNLAVKANDRETLLTSILSLAEAYYTIGNLQQSDSLYKYVLQLSKESDHGTYICNALIGLAKTHLRQNLLKEALANGLEGLQKAETMGQVQLMRDANEVVSGIYEAMHDDANALKYFRNYKLYSDSLSSITSQRAVSIEKANYEFSKKETEFERKTLQQQWIIGSAFAGLVLLAIIIWALKRNKRRLDRTYKELQKKNILIEDQKLKAEDTLKQLQSAQAQLIQSEKMASLGELTAGIAHEIQNPLNFVTNFSEVSSDLLDEMKEELLNNNKEDAIAIANDVKQNLEKINHHGKRADAIVKGMLQHSRSSTGQKEFTDINALCDEYLRLSYHGLRAKDKSFNANFKTDFDETIGKINIVPQDVGRVLLNLFNNAFYAVSKKNKDLEGFQNLQGLQDYKSLVSVTTRKIKLANNNVAANSPSGAGDIEIIVADNGNGIPSSIIDKIFQPFFTTKPTGQGTGLGLSLSYDIIKAHGGTIKVESKNDEGSKFIITLPAF